MTTRYEYTFWQSMLPFLRSSYRFPSCDLPAGLRRLDTTRVHELTDTPAFAGTVVANDELVLPRAFRPGEQSAPGIPCQFTDRAEVLKVVERSPYRNEQRTVLVHQPVAGDLWVSRTPWPVWRQSSMSYDRAARIIADDGSTVELIGVTPVHAGECHAMGVARYDRNGELHPDDIHVTRGPVQATRLYVDRAEPPHRLGIVIRGDDKDPNATAIDQWVALDPAAVPSNLTPDAERLASMLVEHGALTYDRGGVCSLTQVAGAQWNGVDLGGWRPSMADLRLVAT